MLSLTRHMRLVFFKIDDYFTRLWNNEKVRLSRSMNQMRMLLHLHYNLLTGFKRGVAFFDVKP